MLVSLTPKPQEYFDKWWEDVQNFEGSSWGKDDTYTRAVFDQFNCVHEDSEIEPGIYDSPLNFPEESFVEKLDTWGDWSRNISNMPYCVSDNIEQLLDYWKDEINDPNNKYIIAASGIYQDEQPSEGGWRWHKWGPYIGKMPASCEYLYDEDFSNEPDWQGMVIVAQLIKVVD